LTASFCNVAKISFIVSQQLASIRKEKCGPTRRDASKCYQMKELGSKECALERCKVIFTPRKNHQRFCCPAHRAERWEIDNPRQKKIATLPETKTSEQKGQ